MPLYRDGSLAHGTAKASTIPMAVFDRLRSALPVCRLVPFTAQGGPVCRVYACHRRHDREGYRPAVACRNPLDRARDGS
jgi:hypothetical protein